jgi:hypothetical protein
VNYIHKAIWKINGAPYDEYNQWVAECANMREALQQEQSKRSNKCNCKAQYYCGLGVEHFLKQCRNQEDEWRESRHSIVQVNITRQVLHKETKEGEVKIHSYPTEY